MRSKIFKFMKNNLYGFIIGGILFSIISVSAATYLYNSNQVSYNNGTSSVTDVKGAIDELYNKVEENKNYYYDLGRKSIYSGNSSSYQITWDSSSVLSGSVTSPSGYGSNSKSISGKTGHINLLKNPDGNNALLTSLELSFFTACWVGGDFGNSKYTFNLYDQNDKLINSWSYGNIQGVTTKLDITLSNYDIDSDYVYITYNGYLEARGYENELTWSSKTEFNVTNSITLNYK